GAHLGQEDPPLDRLGPQVPPDFLLGLSVGSPAEAERGRAWPADYWSVGPCFHTANKPDAGVPLGAEGFARLARLAPAGTPVIGIGGVTAANAPALARAGAAGVAVSGAVWEASDHGAGRLGGNADAHEQARVLGCREEGIPRNLELSPGEVRHLGEAQALPHGEALLDPPAALQRRDHVGPRFVLPQQVHAALERACQ